MYVLLSLRPSCTDGFISSGWDVILKVHDILKEKNNQADKMYTTRTPYWMKDNVVDQLNHMAINTNAKEGGRIAKDDKHGWYIESERPTKVWERVDYREFHQNLRAGTKLPDDTESDDGSYTTEDGLKDLVHNEVGNLIQRNFLDESPKKKVVAKKKTKEDAGNMLQEELPDLEATIDDQKAIAFCIERIWKKSSPQKLEREEPGATFYMLQLISLEDEANDGQIYFYEWEDLKKAYKIKDRQ